MAEAEINSSKRSFHGEWPRLDLFFFFFFKKMADFIMNLAMWE